MYLLPSQKPCNGKAVAEVLSRVSKTPCSPANPPEAGFFLGGCIVNPRGIIALPDNCNMDDAVSLCHQLLEEGYSYYPSTDDPVLVDGENVPVDHGTQKDFIDPRLSRNDNVKYVMLSMERGNLTDYDLSKLEALVASRASLLKKVLSTDDLSIISKDDKIFFPWFIDHGARGELQAYLDLITRLVNYAQCKQRISAKDRPSPNEKLEMGIFLTKIGIPENKYPRSRKLLLRNLNSAASAVDYLGDDPSMKKHLPTPRVYLYNQSMERKPQNESKKTQN
ncbi:MAG: hypothetical protein IJ153_01785 [Clostridia bacterium]|nr:hypothetical protein [Clostridia bacterium]